jgi:hypothetical protein
MQYQSGPAKYARHTPSELESASYPDCLLTTPCGTMLPPPTNCSLMSSPTQLIKPPIIYINPTRQQHIDGTAAYLVEFVGIGNRQQEIREGRHGSVLSSRGYWLAHQILETVRSSRLKGFWTETNKPMRRPNKRADIHVNPNEKGRGASYNLTAGSAE